MPALNRLYDSSPVALQNMAISLAGWWTQRRRFGHRFGELLQAAEHRFGLEPEALLAYRDDRVRLYVAHCAATVPFWQRRFADLGVNPADIRSLADLSQLPVLTKDEVRVHQDEFYSSAWPASRCESRGTGGTTGASLRFHATPDAVREQWAVWWRYWSWHGIRRSTWCGYFVGIDVIPSHQKQPPYWRMNHPRRQVMFSAFHLRPGTLSHYVAELRRRQLPWLHGYPSVLSIVAQHLLETGQDLGYQPCWVTTGAENLMPHQIATMERAFGVRPRQHYGLAEGVANLSECEHGALHVDEDFAAVEFLPGPESGAAHRLIGTNLSNPAFCLLRYDTGDLVSPGPDRGCPCGRPGRLVSAVDGRLEDTIVLADGTRLGRLAHIFQHLDCLREAQIHQASPGAVTLRIVPVSGFGTDDETAVLAAARRRLGNDTTIHLERLERLPRGRNGKLRFVVSDLGHSDTRSTEEPR